MFNKRRVVALAAFITLMSPGFAFAQGLLLFEIADQTIAASATLSSVELGVKGWNTVRVALSGTSGSGVLRVDLVWLNSTNDVVDTFTGIAVSAGTPFSTPVVSDRLRIDFVETGGASSITVTRATLFATIGNEISQGGSAGSFAGLTDVTITSAAANETLRHDGTNWVNTGALFSDGTGGGTTGNFDLDSDAGLLRLGDAQDVILARDAANVLALRNGLNPQSLAIYGEFTTGSNFQRGRVRFNGDAFQIDTFSVGGPGGSVVNISPGGLASSTWSFALDGDFLSLDDNVNSIGAPGANRPDIGFFGTALVMGADPAAAGVFRVPNQEWLRGRNVANSADVLMIRVTTNNQIELGPSGNFFVEANVLRARLAAGPQMINESATSTNPTLLPNRADINTGIGWVSADILSLIAGGTQNITMGGSTVGFFGVPAASRAGATDDIKDALVAYGLLQGTSATPLDLDGGGLTSGDLTVEGTGPHIFSGDIFVFESASDPRIVLGDSSGAGDFGFLQWDSATDEIRISTSIGADMIRIGEAPSLGFFGTTPVARDIGWSLSAVTDDTTLDCTGFTGNEEILCDVLGTLILELGLDFGLLGG